MAQKRSGPSTSDGGPDSAETAAYIADLTRELADLARQSRLEIVAYLLGIVQMEAMSTAVGLDEARGMAGRRPADDGRGGGLADPPA